MTTKNSYRIRNEVNKLLCIFTLPILLFISGPALSASIPASLYAQSSLGTPSVALPVIQSNFGQTSLTDSIGNLSGVANATADYGVLKTYTSVQFVNANAGSQGVASSTARFNDSIIVGSSHLEIGSSVSLYGTLQLHVNLPSTSGNEAWSNVLEQISVNSEVFNLSQTNNFDLVSGIANMPKNQNGNPIPTQGTYNLDSHNTIYYGDGSNTIFLNFLISTNVGASINIQGDLNSSSALNVGGASNISTFADASNTGLFYFDPIYSPDITLTSASGASYINPVPEPKSYAMMLAGLGLMGFMVCRRKNSQA